MIDAEGQATLIINNTESKAPKIRFKQFSQFLNSKKLGEVVSFKSGGTPPLNIPQYWNGNIPWISAASMIGKYYSSSEKYITDEGLKAGSKLATKNSLLLLVRGSMLYNKIPVGIAEIDVAFNQDVKALFVNDNVLSEYLYQWISSKENYLLGKVVTTGMGAGKLDTNLLENLPILLPSIIEQQKIASFLAAVDKKIALLKRRKELLEQYKKGVMQQLFSRKLRFKDKKGKEFPDWEEKKLAEVASFYNGKAYQQKELLDSGKYKVLRVGNFFSNSNWYFSDLELDATKYCEKGDLLYAWSASFGPKIWDGDKTIYHYHIWKVVNNTLVTKRFLFHILNIHTEEIKTSSSNGFALLHITKGTIENWKCNIPSLEEQTTISTFIDQLENKLLNLNECVINLKLFKQSLLQQMFV